MNDLSENAKFFDRLVDLVPAKYYHPSDQELVNTKYLKKNAKAAAKQVMKQQYKQNKRAKLNPDTAKTSLQIQQQQAEGLQQSDSDEDDDDEKPVMQQPAQAKQPEPVKMLNLPEGEARVACACMCQHTVANMPCLQVLYHPTSICKKSYSSVCRYVLSNLSNSTWVVARVPLQIAFANTELIAPCRNCASKGTLMKRPSKQAKARSVGTRTRTKARASRVHPKSLAQLQLPKLGDSVS